MSAADPLARLREREQERAAADAAGRPAARFPSFRLLEVLSFVHSFAYAGVLWFFLGPENETGTRVFGWAHGWLWIGMSLLCILGARRRTIPFWLAVLVAVVGGLGPFAGTIGFLIEERRRRRNRVVQGG